MHLREVLEIAGIQGTREGDWIRRFWDQIKELPKDRAFARLCAILEIVGIQSDLGEVLVRIEASPNRAKLVSYVRARMNEMETADPLQELAA